MSTSARAMIKPPMMAPGIEVKPPSIRTGSAFRAIRLRLNCTPDLVPHIIPATNATNPAIDQTNTQIKLRETPTLNAA